MATQASNLAAWIHIQKAMAFFIKTPGDKVPIKSIMSKTAAAQTRVVAAELDAAIADGRLVHHPLLATPGSVSYP